MSRENKTAPTSARRASGVQGLPGSAGEGAIPILSQKVIGTILESLAYSKQKILDYDHSGLSNAAINGRRLDDKTIHRMFEEGKKVKQMSLTPIDEAILAIREYRDIFKEGINK